MNARQRANLLKLAAYLESLPRDYKHFDMHSYAQHRGDCDLPTPLSLLAATKPAEFLSNCGTVACAVGHGPAAGIKVLPIEIDRPTLTVDWPEYSDRVFGTDEFGSGADSEGPFEFLFGSAWQNYDNHHYGAAARIRYFLDTGNFDGWRERTARRRYAPYRKGSRSAKRREIEQVSA